MSGWCARCGLPSERHPHDPSKCERRPWDVPPAEYTWSFRNYRWEGPEHVGGRRSMWPDYRTHPWSEMDDEGRVATIARIRGQ